MAETILFGIAEELLQKLGSTAIMELYYSVWNYKAELNKLNNTINTLKGVLLDAEEKQVNNHLIRGWLERLATVIYAADDLFDELNVVAAQEELMGEQRLAKRVRTFLSLSNSPVALACRISWNVKNIREQLDDIVKDGTQFEFVCGSPEIESVTIRRDQTMSYVNENEVFGRDDEKKDILDMLLASSSSGNEDGHEEVPIVVIVGMGGMGKTTLAQLMYNDPHLKESFDLRLWVCVSDVFDIKVIIEKLLKSATNNETPNLEMDQLQVLLRKVVMGKRYLLVLDDVWNEQRKEWLILMDLLKIGRKGSKILVTTRSKEVAKIMGAPSPYELQGLSEERSWKLFEKMAFNLEEADQKPHLVKIGKEIVKKCGRVPLAIRTLGSLLYGQEERRWLYVKNTSSFTKIPDNKVDILDILRLSYHHLWSPLKNCFAYCALFPKDYEFEKEMLIDLWIAEGYIVPSSNDDQSLDEVAEEYFHTLLQRGFFQNIKRNSLGIIQSCKMHDFMHNLAQEVGGVKYKVAKSHERDFDEKTVHLSLSCQLTSSWEIPNSMLNMKLLRTFLLPQQILYGSPCGKSINQLITRFRSLRVLDLKKLRLKSLPSSIGKLIHLRYLNLSETPIEKLPGSITDLWNLQTLRLGMCWKLRTLPAEIRKLTNLRSLDIEGCFMLTHLPAGLGELTSLSSLPRFIVNLEHDAAELRYETSSKLSDLKYLNNLRGKLEIEIQGSSESTMLEAREVDLSSKHGVTQLTVFFEDGVSDSGGANCNCAEAVLESLEPPSNVKDLRIYDYRGQRLPSWIRLNNICTTLPNVVEIILRGWKWCQELPAFSQLPFLRRLKIWGMESVEYIESGVCSVPSSTSKTAEIKTRLFFPSLEELVLFNMRNLKGWWKEVEVAGKRYKKSMQLSRLSKLDISDCPNLRLLPLCPNVEEVSLLRVKELVSVFDMVLATTSSEPSSSSSEGSWMKLKKLRVDNTEELMSLPTHCLHQLTSIHFSGDRKLDSTNGLGDVFATLSSSLRSLRILSCSQLKSITKGLENLTALEKLELYNCKELDVSGNEAAIADEEGMPWKALNNSLHSLRLGGLPKLMVLPSGLQHLANLRSLELTFNRELVELPEWMSCFSSLKYLLLRDCPKLTSLPEAFCKLTSLNYLDIIDCPGLTEGCQGPNGSDWPKIQHIPLLSVKMICL